MSMSYPSRAMFVTLTGTCTKVLPIISIYRQKSVRPVSYDFVRTRYVYLGEAMIFGRRGTPPPSTTTAREITLPVGSTLPFDPSISARCFSEVCGRARRGQKSRLRCVVMDTVQSWFFFSLSDFGCIIFYFYSCGVIFSCLFCLFWGPTSSILKLIIHLTVTVVQLAFPLD